MHRPILVTGIVLVVIGILVMLIPTVCHCPAQLTNSTSTNQFCCGLPWAQLITGSSIIGIGIIVSIIGYQKPPPGPVSDSQKHP